MAVGFLHGTGIVGEQMNIQYYHFCQEKSTDPLPPDPKENDIWMNTSNAKNGWTYGFDMPIRKSKNKNYVTYPPSEAVVNGKVVSVIEKNGLTFTLDTDMKSSNPNSGKITVNGTATGTNNTFYRQSFDTIESGLFFLPPGKYFMSGCPSGGSRDTYMLGFARVDLSSPNQGIGSVYDTGNGAEITIPEGSLCRIAIVIKPGTKIENKTFYFQIEAGTSATSYERGNANGQVWFVPGSNSIISLEAFKRSRSGNSIIFSPEKCWLFRNNDLWDDYTDKVKLYKNGEWIPMVPPEPEEPDVSPNVGPYYDAGNQYTSLTGGWTTDGWSHSPNGASSFSAINDSNLKILCTGGSFGAVGTINKMNLSGVNTIKVDMNVKYRGAKLEVCISTSNDIKNNTATKSVTALGQQTVALDVSNYNDSYYVVIYTVGDGTNGGEATITKVWGE